MTRLRDARFLAGLFFLALGGAVAAVAQNYALGSLTRMGPGYFPTMLGVALMLIGAVLAARAARGAEAAESLNARPLGLISLAVVIFAVGLKPLGLFVTAMLLVGISSLARPGSRLRTLIVLAPSIAALASLLFVGALGLRLPVWPS